MKNENLKILREEMKKEGLSAFIFPSADAHNSEYTPAHWHGREWISGFSGSAGTAVVTMDKAALWTDSRYFIAAAEMLQDTEFELMKDGLPSTPTISKWLGHVLSSIDGAEVGVDGFCYTQHEAQAMRTALRHEGGITLRTNLDILSRIWKDRPQIPQNKVFMLPEEYTGSSAKEKLHNLRKELSKQHVCGILVSALDEIAWLLNLRGSDAHCTPVFVAYLLLEQEKTTLYIDSHKVDDDVARYLHEQGVGIDDYTHIEKALHSYTQYNILLDSHNTSCTLYEKVKCQEIIDRPSPIARMKAVKNETELKGIRNAMLKDGIALTKLCRWLKTTVQEDNASTSELSVDEQLLTFKKEQPLFHGLSFDTIVGYQEHGAIVHYEATEKTNIPIKPNGLLLVDCGSQYLDGTTDITRTFAVGSLTKEEKDICTTVLKAHIRLAKARWTAGTTGTQLDILARGVVWDAGYHYGHGTGHGVGCFLSCHEGPQRIRNQYSDEPLVPGMIVSNEPGIYVEGKYGCRWENLLLVVADGKGVQGEDFYKFEYLSLCPFDKETINVDMLTADEKDWVNTYHQKVYETLSPYLDSLHSTWLKTACAPIN
ncbi:MAG: aminopeptidase P family protein [Prevotella sp.]|nr:aminopeptidase P family protein [Candidatus Equicola stercoris]